MELVAERADRSGVVYAGTRDGVDKLAARLAARGVPALAYHAGLDKDLRTARLEQFLDADAAVMVATIAFGMGVDKPDVRYVIHADPPASIEAYWQEIGRAGRDGAPAEGITLYSASDLAWALRRIDGRDVDATVKAVQVRKARQLYAMLDGTGCRAAGVRRYFGEAGVERLRAMRPVPQSAGGRRRHRGGTEGALGRASSGRPLRPRPRRRSPDRQDQGCFRA